MSCSAVAHWLGQNNKTGDVHAKNLVQMNLKNVSSEKHSPEKKSCHKWIL